MNWRLGVAVVTLTVRLAVSIKGKETKVLFVSNSNGWSAEERETLEGLKAEYNIMGIEHDNDDRKHKQCERELKRELTSKIYEKCARNGNPASKKEIYFTSICERPAIGSSGYFVYGQLTAQFIVADCSTTRLGYGAPQLQVYGYDDANDVTCNEGDLVTATRPSRTKPFSVECVSFGFKGRAPPPEEEVEDSED